MADVFLSYKREDQKVAREVATDLEAEGFSVFFDVAIEVGDSWDERIENELNAAKAVVVLWSPKSRESKWVKREAREAMERGILCPAMIARCKVPLEFSDVQASDLVGRRAGDRAHAEWQRLCERIGKCVGRKARAIATPKVASIQRPDGDSRPIDATGTIVAPPPTPQLLNRRTLAIGGVVAGGVAAVAAGSYGWTRLRESAVERSWQEARAAGTRSAVREFLHRHPNAQQASDARSLIERLPLAVRQSLVLRGPDGISRGAAFSPTGAYVAASYISNNYARTTTSLWECATGREVGVVSGDYQDFSPDGIRLITIGDGNAHIWTCSTGREDRAFAQGAYVIYASYSPDGARIAADGSGSKAVLCDASTGARIALLGSERDLQGIAFSPDSRRVATFAIEDTAYVWDAVSGRLITSLQGHRGQIFDAAFSSDSERIVTASSDHSARVWEVAAGRTIATLLGHEDEVRSAAFSPDGSRIVTTSSDRTARLWDASAGAMVAELPGGEHEDPRARFSPNGARVVTTYSENYVNTHMTRMWDGTTGRQIETLRGMDVVSFSRDGSRGLAISGDYSVRVIDMHQGVEIASLRGHDRKVTSANFAFDGIRILTASDDHTVRIWEIDEDA